MFLLDEFENYIVAETDPSGSAYFVRTSGNITYSYQSVYSKAEALLQTTGFFGGGGEWTMQDWSAVHVVVNKAFAAQKVVKDGDKALGSGM